MPNIQWCRDKLITELRLKMPASADPDGVTAQKVKNSVNPTDTLNANKADFGENHSLRIAQTTINNLKQRIQQKDETVFKYQQLLSQARNDLQDMNRYHEEELKSMQQKIHLKTDDAFNKFKETAEALMNKQTTSRSSINKQIANQLELENMLSESEKAIKSLSEKLKQREEELRQMHSKMVAIEKLNNKESFVETPKIDTMQDEKKESNYIVDELQREIAILNEEINTLKDTTGKRATQSMKNLVERLKNQLTQKEKQHQALSKALKELQAEMVTQAQDALKVNLDNLGDEKNIQKLIDQQTDQYRDEIEDLKTEREKLRKEMKRRKEENSKHLSELEDLQEELALKEKTVSKLRSEKHSLEEMVAEYEKKLERISAKNQKKPLDYDRQGELEETRRRLHMVEEKLKKRELMAEKPYEKENQKEDTTARWEENKKWRKTVEKMKNKLVERDGEISELKRTIEMLKLENTRVKPASNIQLQSHRPIEFSQSNRVIQKEKISELESFEKGKKYIQSEMVSSPRSVGSSMSSIKRIGESGKSIRELEKTIALMKRVIEKCQTENDMLKQTMSGFRSEKISLLEQENDALKKEINDIKYQTAQNFHEHETTQKKGTMKLMNDYEKLRKELLKEKEINEKLMLNLHTKEIEHEHQCKQLESIKSKQEIEEAKKLSSNTDYSGWKSAVVTRMYEDQIKNLQSDIEKKNKQLFDQKKLLKEAAEKEVDLMDKIKQLHHQVSILERLPNLNDTELMKEYHQARTKISKLEYDNELLLRDLKLHRENDQVNEDILSKARKYDQILEENIEIKMNLRTALIERDQYKQSSSKVRKELGPESFEEMEDLKYNYKQAVQKNIMYEEKLVNISKQFGIDINIPGLE